MGRQNKVVKRRPAKRLVKRRARVATLPPPLPFGRTALRGIIRHGSSDTININACLTKEISWSEILIGVWASIATVFSEIKLTKVVCWMTPSAAMNANGLQCLILCPADELKDAPSAPKFTNLGSVPGSTIRKVYQTVHREWHPTSPFEKGWHRTNSKDPLLRFLYMTTNMKQGNGIDGSNFACETVFDFHIKARGMGSTSLLKEDGYSLITTPGPSDVAIKPAVSLSSMYLDEDTAD